MNGQQPFLLASKIEATMRALEGLSRPQLILRILELEAQLDRLGGQHTLAQAVLSARVPQSALLPQPRIGRPPIPYLEAKQIAWARAAEPGGKIERYLDAYQIQFSPRHSASARIRTLVFSLLADQALPEISQERRRQIAARFVGYAKRGRALLRNPLLPAGLVHMAENSIYFSSLGISDQGPQNQAIPRRTFP